MKLSTASTLYQIYLTPYLTVTHDKMLNGNYEIIAGWLKWQLIIEF